MKLRLQIIIESDNGSTELMQEVVNLQRGQLQPSDLGLTLTEAKEILASVQQTMVTHQVSEYVKEQQICSHCKKSRAYKGHHEIIYRSVFGKMKLDSPRFYTCSCDCATKQSFSPLSELLKEHTSPQLLYLESKFAALMSYGVTVELLKDILPIGHQLNSTTVRRDIYQIAQKMETDLAPEQGIYLSSSDWENIAAPKGAQPLAIGLDGGYIHARGRKGRRDGCFEVIVGKSLAADRPTKCFAFVNCYETKPKRKIFEVLKSQALERGQPVTFLSDGGETVRELGFDIYPQAEHILDWFHITMRLTVMGQLLKAVPKADSKELSAEIEKDLQRLKWYLWHGNIYKACQTSEHLIMDMDCLKDGAAKNKLLKAIEEFDTYIKSNHHLIPNYGDRYRYGERISTGFVESTVNQVVTKRFVKKQQMCWSKRGAHLLLQVRTKVLNDELQTIFLRWYPGLKLSLPEVEVAA